MLKVVKSGKIEQEYEFLLEDGTELYIQDWNGEYYCDGFKDGKSTNKRYKPVYTDDFEEIVGYEEI